MKAFIWKKVVEKKHRLFVRIFLYGLLIIFVVSVAIAVAFALLGNTRVWHALPTRLAEELSRDMEPGRLDQTKLNASLEKLHRILKADMAVYTYGGVEVAKAGSDPPPPVDEAEARQMTRRKILRHWGTTLMFLPIPSKPNVEPSYVVMDWPFGGDPRRMFVGLVIIILLVALISIPAARALTRPLEQVTSTAKRLAKGELSARTGVERGDEVGVLAATIDEMATLLQRRIAGEKELIANVSHEIRTPLSRLKVALELCDDESTSERELREHLVGMTNDVEELDELIDDVLTVARLDIKGTTGDRSLVTVRKKKVNPVAVAEACVARFEKIHPSRKISLLVDDFGEEIFIDEKLFRRALDNLLDNAVKYSESPTAVEFRVSSRGQKVVFEVFDRGIGISMEDVPNLFEPFYRTERSRTRRAGGSGLGLTLCKRIAEAHDAEIDVLQRAGGGTIFRVVLPKRAEDY